MSITASSIFNGIPEPIKASRGQLLMIEGNLDTTNTYQVLSTYPRTYGYDASNNLTSETATDPANGNVFVKTYAYTNGNLTSASGWVKQ